MLRAVSTSIRSVQYLFVDGGYLDEVLESFGRRFLNGATPAPDYLKFSSEFTKVFYYHSPPESDEQKYLARMDQLSELGGWHVIHGVTRRTPKKKTQQQKEVDVQLAVDLLSHTFRRNMDSVTLLTGDLDFRPAVEAVVRDGMFLTLWSDRRTTASELRQAADATRPLDPWCLSEYLRGPKPELPTRQTSYVASFDGWTPLLGTTTPLGKHFVLSDSGRNLYRITAQEESEDGRTYLSYEHSDKQFLLDAFDRILDTSLTWEALS